MQGLPIGRELRDFICFSLTLSKLITTASWPSLYCSTYVKIITYFFNNIHITLLVSCQKVIQLAFRFVLYKNMLLYITSVYRSL